MILLKPRSPSLIQIRALSKFFRPNKYPITIKDKESLPDATLHRFVPSSWLEYHELASDSKPFRTSLINHLPLKERLARPSIGSLVEYQKDERVQLGVVLSDQQFLFRRNHYEVLNMDSSTELVHNAEVRFILNEFIKPKVLDDEKLVNDCVRSFVRLSQEQISKHFHLSSVIQAWYSKRFVPQQIDLLEVTQLVKSNIKEKINDDALLFGLYLYFQNDPYNYTVLQFDDYINDLKTDALGSQPKVLLNPIYESELLEHSHGLSSYVREEFNGYLKQFLNGEASLFDEFLKDPTIEEFEDFQSIITTMKQFIRNPHPFFIEELSTILSGVCEVTPKDVHHLLTEFGIYKKTTQIFNYEPSLPVSLKHLFNHDSFSHIRTDHTLRAFALPSVKLQNQLDSKDYSDLAISLDVETNPDVWELNIHFPDIASILNKNDEILPNLLERVDKSLFNRETLKTLSFSEGGENRAFTIKLKYDLNRMKRWNEVGVEISLTRLEDLKIIPINELNHIWKSRRPNLENFLTMLFKQDDGLKKLNKDDVDVLNHFFTMIDYWYFKRNEIGSMEYQFPSKKIKLGEDGELAEIVKEDAYSFLEYITKEIDLIVSNYALQYSTNNEIPLLVKSQELVNFKINDKIQITSSEFLIPDYQTSNFQNLIFNKDDNGLTSLQNYIVALQFLKPITTSPNLAVFASLGLKGYVKLLSPLFDFENIVNQWQLLDHIHSNFVNDVWNQNELIQFDLNKIYPKNYEQFDKEQLMNFFNLKVQPMINYNKLSELHQSRFLKLVKLQTELNSWNIYRCVVLKSSSTPSNGASTEFTKAYCFELDLQVEIEHSEMLLIGDQVICSEISVIDPYTSQIALKL